MADTSVLTDGLLGDRLLVFFRQKYTQHADERQAAMGLRYTTAETIDLAAETARFIKSLIAE